MRKVLDNIALMITTYQILVTGVFSNLCPLGSLQSKYHSTTSNYSQTMIMSALMKFAIICKKSWSTSTMSAHSLHIYHMIAINSLIFRSI